MSRTRILTYILVFVVFSAPFWAASYTATARTSHVSPDKTYIPKDSVVSVKVDSTKNVADSLLTDTLSAKKSPLDAVVEYTANDSIVMTAGNLGYLYGESEVHYTNLILKSENISMNMDSSTAKATFGIDSIGKEFGYPIFSEGGVDYEAKLMRYNFKSKKMFVNGVITEQGDGYVTADIAKKTEGDAFFMRGGRYTTCDEHEHPHFYFALTKGKVRPKKNVVTGPAYLVIEGLPLPIGVPFGFFPFSDKYSSGVIMPSFGDEMERGFFLHNGGYYFAINDNIDLALTGEIYTKGSWGLNARSTYRKRYKYSGSFDLGYRVTKYGDKAVPNTYSLNKDMSINWTHSQDPKSNMYRTLSASVNFTTGSYDRNDLVNNYSGRSTQNTKSSSVSLNQRFPNSPWSLSATMNIDQRTSDSTLSMTLPNMTISMTRVQPFKRKKVVGGERWYEKIQLSYRGEFRNSLRSREDEFFKKNPLTEWDHAMKHTIPISATYSLFDYINISPSINYTERWYTQKVHQEWNGSSRIKTDTINSFSRVSDFNAAISFQTKMYGTFIPLFDKKSRIRHVFTPSVTFSYAPDFSNPEFGYYKSYDYYDSNGDLKTQKYSYYEGMMFGGPSSGKTGSIGFSFENNLEMKRQMTDTIKKISLIDNLGISFSHNLAADSLKWSDINTNIRLKLSKSLTINLTAGFDPYKYDFNRDSKGNVVRNSDGKVTGLTKVDKLRITHGGSFGRLTRTGYSISPSINQDTFKKWFGSDEEKKKLKKKEKDDELEDDVEDDLLAETTPTKERGSLFEKKADTGEYDADGYLRNEVKWSLSAAYSFNYGWDMSRIDEKAKEFKYKLTHSLSFNGSIQPTKNWSFNFNSSYDFERKEISYLNCNVTRSLHCWTITASFIPVGQYKSYFVSLRADASMLQDLKYDKRGRSSSYDPQWE